MITKNSKNIKDDNNEKIAKNDKAVYYNINKVSFQIIYMRHVINDLF